MKSADAGQGQKQNPRSHTWSRKSSIWSSNARTRLRRPSSAARVCSSCMFNTTHKRVRARIAVITGMGNVRVKFAPANPTHYSFLLTDVHATSTEHDIYQLHILWQKNKTHTSCSTTPQEDGEAPPQKIRESRIVWGTVAATNKPAPPLRHACPSKHGQDHHTQHGTPRHENNTNDTTQHPARCTPPKIIVLETRALPWRSFRR